MPKVAKKYYAVAVGREGPKIYDTWDEAASTVSPSQNSNLSTRDEALPFAGPLPSHSTPPSSFPEQQQPIEDNFKPLAPRPSVTLSPEQQQVLDRVNNGQSVFFTGSAGTGKSVLLREIIASLKERGDRVAITASTGIAAVNIGGSTLHSWAGIGLAEEAVERYVGKFLHNKQLFKVLERWQNVTTLIIDEVLIAGFTIHFHSVDGRWQFIRQTRRLTQSHKL
ncbi:hypothetical protein H0H87_010165 [Tephrocybe sp. NHM501043]|nr:hypothetical protein H0H87_010165 [Tephrocybe sp. NHM501043]